MTFLLFMVSFDALPVNYQCPCMASIEKRFSISECYFGWCLWCFLLLPFLCLMVLRKKGCVAVTGTSQVDHYCINGAKV